MYFILLLTYLQNVLSQTICKSNTIDFSSKTTNFSNYLTIDYNSDNVVYKNGVASLRLDKTKGGTRISLKDQLHYGKVDVKMKIAKGSNVVSSFIFLAKNGDEIDFEFVQNSTELTDLIQTNYFYRGIPIYDKNAKMYSTKKILSENFHTYSLKWDPLYYEWYFDNVLLRRLYKNQTQNYPDSISSVQFGIWEAPPSNWAGNGTDWSTKVFNFDISYIKISCIGNSTSTTDKEIKIPNNYPSVTKTKTKTRSIVTQVRSYPSREVDLTPIKSVTKTQSTQVSSYPTTTTTTIIISGTKTNSSLKIGSKWIYLINLLLILL